jgi:hypothetical protein
LAILLLVSAVLPNAIFAGHWAARTLPPEATDMAVSDHDHAGHDHVNPAAATNIWWATHETTVSLVSDQERAQRASAGLFRPDPLLPHPAPPPRYL